MKTFHLYKVTTDKTTEGKYDYFYVIQSIKNKPFDVIGISASLANYILPLNSSIFKTCVNMGIPSKTMLDRISEYFLYSIKFSLLFSNGLYYDIDNGGITFLKNKMRTDYHVCPTVAMSLNRVLERDRLLEHVYDTIRYTKTAQQT